MNKYLQLIPTAAAIIFGILFYNSCQTNHDLKDTLSRDKATQDSLLRQVLRRDTTIRLDSVLNHNAVAFAQRLMHSTDSLVASLPHEQQKLKDAINAVHAAVLRSDTSTLKQQVLWANPR